MHNEEKKEGERRRRHKNRSRSDARKDGEGSSISDRLADRPSDPAGQPVSRDDSSKEGHKAGTKSRYSGTHDLNDRSGKSSGTYRGRGGGGDRSKTRQHTSMRAGSSMKQIQEEFLRGISVPRKVENFKPDEFQLRAIESIAKGVDTLVVAPTGTGKTYIAVQGIAQTISSGKRAVYTAPLKALSNTKYTEFRKRFEPHFTVGLLTGDRKIDGDADVVVATTEIYRNELYNYGDNYSLVVLDEFHYLADSQRGPVWEESIILSPKNSALLMLSASVSNAEEIADWIKSVRGREVEIITETHRPVELRLGFLHPTIGVMPLQNSHGEIMREVEDFYNFKPDTRIRGDKDRGGGGYGQRPGGRGGSKRKGGGRGKSKGAGGKR